MTWFLLSILAAFSLATADALTKRYLGHLSPYAMGLGRLLFALPWLLGALLVIPVPPVDRVFFYCLALGLPLELLAFTCYMKALKVSPLSLSLPFLAFTPVFVILSGWLFLGEKVSPAGALGIFLIVVGSYLLNLSRAPAGVLEPLRAVWREPGSRLMLFVALLYGVTSANGKLAILHSSPAFFAVVYFVLLTLCVFVLALRRGFRTRDLRTLFFPGAMLVGIFVAAMIISHVIAISLTQAAYMIALKRTSVLFGVLYGAFLFKEEKMRERIVGTGIMVAGIFLIASGS